MTKAVLIHKHGGPEELTYESVEVGSPNFGEVRLKHTSIGLNYIDIYHRMGGHGGPTPPAIIGAEGVGIVEELGGGVSEVKVGDRVGYGPCAGSYAQERIISADRLVHIPDAISDEIASAALMKGMTAEYLIRRCYPVKRGETILVYAAAGGVGSILCQWANYLGATVIGIVGSEEKAEIALGNGCKHVINYKKNSIPKSVGALTSGKGVPVVFDSAGGATFNDSLDCLAKRGFMISYGNSSGDVNPISLSDLMSRGSLYLTRPTLATYCLERNDILESSESLFKVMISGHVKIKVGQRYLMKDIRNAHYELESGSTKNSSIIIP